MVMVDGEVEDAEGVIGGGQWTTVLSHTSIHTCCTPITIVVKYYVLCIKTTVLHVKLKLQPYVRIPYGFQRI